jgi:hypothetical protein
MGAPLLWVGASPVLVYNLLIIAGLALSGWSMYLLMRRWTDSEWAGIIAGLVYAFNAHVLTRFVHLQAQHVEFFPLVLYAFDRLLMERRLKDVFVLGLAFVLQALCSNYLLVFTTYALVVSAAVRWKEINTNHKRFGLLVAGVLSVAVLAPFLSYYEVSRDRASRRVRCHAVNATGDYLATAADTAWWSHRFFGRQTALSGVTALACARGRHATAHDWRSARAHGDCVRRRRVRLLVRHGATGLRACPRVPSALERTQKCRALGMAAAGINRDPRRIRCRHHREEVALRADRSGCSRDGRSNPHSGRIHAGL